jgi:heptosyltransferase-2
MLNDPGGNGSPRHDRILVVLPNWVGDVVLATAALRALREHHPDAHITYLLKPYVQELIGGCGWVDDVLCWPRGGRLSAMLRLVAALRRGRFTHAVLMTNSFRSALVTATARIPHRLGYDRDGRGFLLTDRLVAPRREGKFLPVSMTSYYNALVSYLGCPVSSRLELATDPVDDDELNTRLAARARVGGGPRVVLNPGAAFGSAKCWLPERFAEVGQRLIDTQDADVVICCGPSEADVAGAISRRIEGPHTLLDDPVVSLRLLKSLIRGSDLLVTNDSGPRHIAVAFDVPVVTIFGPTAPGWTETGYTRERKVLVPVECGPCMLRTCPLDHRCMKLVTADMVVEASAALLPAGSQERVRS